MTSESSLKDDAIISELKEINMFKEYLKSINSVDFATISDQEKRFLENKSLSVLLTNLFHTIFKDCKFDVKGKNEAIRLFYGIKFWVASKGGPFVIETMIVNEYNKDFVHFMIQVLDEYV